MICPNCKTEYDETLDGNWPIEVGGEIVDGGCQVCWEAEVDRKWWETVTLLPDELFGEQRSESDKLRW